MPLLKSFGVLGTVRPTAVAVAGQAVGSSGRGATVASPLAQIKAAVQLLAKLDSYPGLAGLQTFCSAVGEVMVSGIVGATRVHCSLGLNWQLLTP